MKITNAKHSQFRENLYHIPDEGNRIEEAANEALSKLSGLPRKLAKRILGGDSIREAAKYFSIPESTARRLLRNAGKQIAVK